jgi:hypothetical protein
MIRGESIGLSVSGGVRVQPPQKHLGDGAVSGVGRFTPNPATLSLPSPP